MKSILSALLVICAANISNGQIQGSDLFNSIYDAIKAAIPERFETNEGRTTESRFYSIFEFDENGSNLNTLIFKLLPDATSFSEMDIAMGGVKFDWNSRKALYIDGTDTGMSTVAVILNSDKGMFKITHRNREGIKPMDKEELLVLLSKIPLASIEESE